MTTRDPGSAAAPPPIPPAPGRDRPDGSVGPDHVAELARWLGEHAASFTPEALDRSAIAAGYAPGDVGAARRRADARIRSTQALAPIRSTAKRAVVLAYVAVWVAFGVAFLVSPSQPLDFDSVLFVVLTVALVITLAMSFGIIGSFRPDAARPNRALVLLLVVPVVLLLGVAGLCLPFTRISG